MTTTETVTPETKPCCGPSCCSTSEATETAPEVSIVGLSEQGVRDMVREKYAGAARAAAEGKTNCGCGCGTTEGRDPITADLYASDQIAGLPAEALTASLGCGNPTALAELKLGEKVLDLGSGGGIDVLLSARRVGPTGKAYGVDMTDEMLALARENQKKAGVDNVEFLRGEIENLPLLNDEVDVIISNCVINLSANKRKVLSEAFRVLKGGGRFAVSDVVFLGDVPSEVKRDLELWAGCVAGALSADEYRGLLSEAGFEQISIEPTRIYGKADAESILASGQLPQLAAFADAIDGKIASAFIRATKPR